MSHPYPPFLLIHLSTRIYQSSTGPRLPLATFPSHPEAHWKEGYFRKNGKDPGTYDRVHPSAFTKRQQALRSKLDGDRELPWVESDENVVIPLSRLETTVKEMWNASFVNLEAKQRNVRLDFSTPILILTSLLGEFYSVAIEQIDAISAKSKPSDCSSITSWSNRKRL